MRVPKATRYPTYLHDLLGDDHVICVNIRA